MAEVSRISVKNLQTAELWSKTIAESGFYALIVSINEIAALPDLAAPLPYLVLLLAVCVTANSQTSAQSPAGTAYQMS
jgi:hypothetical protein